MPLSNSALAAMESLRHSRNVPLIVTSHCPILIVEDSPEDRLVLATALERRGHEIECVATVAQALNILDAHDPPRVVIVDWVMPDQTGIELVEAIRRRTGTPQPYVIMTSGLRERFSIRKAFLAGVDQYLTKPINFVELHAAVVSGLQHGVSAAPH